MAIGPAYGEQGGGGGSGGSSVLLNIAYFDDGTYEYFVGDIPETSNWQVNRYDNMNARTVATGTGSRPADLTALQALSYV